MTSRTILAAPPAAKTGPAACPASDRAPVGEAASHAADRRSGAQATLQVMFSEGRLARVRQAVAGWRRTEGTDDMPAAAGKALGATLAGVRAAAR